MPSTALLLALVLPAFLLEKAKPSLGTWKPDVSEMRRAKKNKDRRQQVGCQEKGILFLCWLFILCGLVAFFLSHLVAASLLFKKGYAVYRQLDSSFISDA